MPSPVSSAAVPDATASVVDLYSGVGLLTREHPDGLVRGFGTPEFDYEGRYIEVRFGDLSVVSLYMPSGSAGEHRQASKFRFMKVFMEHLRKIRADGRRTANEQALMDAVTAAKGEDALKSA